MARLFEECGPFFSAYRTSLTSIDYLLGRSDARLTDYTLRGTLPVLASSAVILQHRDRIRRWRWVAMKGDSAGWYGRSERDVVSLPVELRLPSDCL